MFHPDSALPKHLTSVLFFILFFLELYENITKNSKEKNIFLEADTGFEPVAPF